jgi:hypothetical protein
MSLFKFNVLLVVVCMLAMMSCKRNKRKFEETQHRDTLVVINREYVPPETVYGSYDGVGYAHETSDSYQTEFRGELVEYFRAHSQRVYNAVRVDDTVEVVLRKQTDGKKGCKIVELVTADGQTFTDFGLACRLWPEARGNSVDGVDQASPGAEEQEVQTEMSAASRAEFFAFLPDSLDELAHIPGEERDRYLDFLELYLESSPGISAGEVDRFVDVATEYLQGNPEVPGEFVARCGTILSQHRAVLPGIAQDFVGNLFNHGLLGRARQFPHLPPSTVMRLPRLPRQLPLEILEQTAIMPFPGPAHSN